MSESFISENHLLVLIPGVRARRAITPGSKVVLRAVNGRQFIRDCLDFGLSQNLKVSIHEWPGFLLRYSVIIGNFYKLGL